MRSGTPRITGFSILAGLVAILAMVASLAGILHPAMYLPFTPDDMMPGALSQDIVSLVSAAALLYLATAVYRGRERLLPVVLGLVGYLFYAYAIYAFDRLYTPFFLIYTSIVGLGVFAVILFFHGVDIGAFSGGRQGLRPPPRRTAAVFLLFLAAMFLIRWLGLVFPAMADGVPPQGNSILVMDLSFFLPLLVLTAVLVLKRTPLGGLLTSVVLVKMGVLGISVLLGELLRPSFGGELDPGGIAVFTLLGPVSLGFAILWLLRTRATDSTR